MNSNLIMALDVLRQEYRKNVRQVEDLARDLTPRGQIFSQQQEVKFIRQVLSQLELERIKYRVETIALQSGGKLSDAELIQLARHEARISCLDQEIAAQRQLLLQAVSVLTKSTSPQLHARDLHLQHLKRRTELLAREIYRIELELRAPSQISKVQSARIEESDD